MRKLALVLLAGLVAAVSVIGILKWGPSPAEAVLPAPCTSPLPTPGTGTTPYILIAAYPKTAGQNANGMCVTTVGSGGQNNSQALVANAAGCTSTTPTVGAGGDQVWADWGTTNCVQPGDTVIITFKSATKVGGTAGVVWNCTGGASTPGPSPTPGATATPVPGSGVVNASSVGGVAEVTQDTADASTAAQDSSSTPYAVIAGAAAAMALAIVAGGWYARRRWLT
ncbi:MAG: hypothetical protein ABR978_02515 [Dehalococcoidia bacterium]|jgi:hypothetical protein